MSAIKYKMLLYFKVDEADYPSPIDGMISEQLQDDIIEAIEQSLPFEIDTTKLVKIGRIKNVEPSEADYDYLEPR